MLRVPTIRPTDDPNGGAKALLTAAALLVAAWAASIVALGWLLLTSE